jgi:predicted RNase H-like nuclease (RuvC/YqgF family)
MEDNHQSFQQEIKYQIDNLERDIERLQRELNEKTRMIEALREQQIKV